MKSSDGFKNAISSHLKTMAAKDPVFAEKMKDENKSIDKCCTYILNTVKKSGCNAFDPDEIFGMATHYYDEKDIKEGPAIQARVVVTHKVDLSPEEIEAAKEQAKEDALNQVIAEEKAKLTKKAAKKKDTAVDTINPLFG